MYHSYYSKLKTGKIRYPLSVVRFPPEYLPEIPCAKELGCPIQLFKLPKEVWKSDVVIKKYKDWYFKMLDDLGIDGLFKIIRKYYPNAPIEEITFMSYTVEPDQRGYICEWLTNHGYPSGELNI